MVYCSNCGTANRDGSTFCNECGTQLPASGGIKCPVCSTLNPSDQVICDNCGARLVPAVVEPAAPDQSTPSRRDISLPSISDISGSEAGPVEDVPDWMRDVSSEEQPDWLSSLSASVPAETPLQPASIEPSSTTPADQVAADDVPDWMSNLHAAAPSMDDTQPSVVQSAQTPDWLNNLNANESAQPPVESSASSDTPEWLRNLTAAAPAMNEPLAQINSPADMPDWLSQLTGAASAPTPEAASSALPEETAITLTSAELSASPAPTEEAAAPDMPDWLKEFGGTPTSESTNAADVPDWLGNLAASMPAETSAPSTDAAIPAWLQEENQPAVLGEEPAQVSDVPDWLREFQSTAEPAVVTTQPSFSIEPAAEPVVETPDWLAAGQAAPSMQEESESIEPAAEPVVETPDTLAARQAAPSMQEESQSIEPAAEPVAATPDWLARLQAASSMQEESESIEPAAEPVVETPDTLAARQAASSMQEESQSIEPAAEPVAATPDWLARLQVASLMQEESQSIEPAAEPVAATPDWLAALQAAPPMQEESQSIEPAAEPVVATPDWLAALQAASPMQEESQSIEPAAEPVAATPDWLAALQAAQPMQSEEEARSTPIAKIDQPAQPIEQAVEPKFKIEKPIQPIQIEPSAPVEAAQPSLETEMPEWLRGMRQAPAAPKPRGPMVPIPPELPPELQAEPAVAPDLPEWLQSLRKGAPAGSAPASSGLAQGEIPEWLEALRPQIGEAQLIDEGPEVETEGVLAGFNQTLPSVPLMGEVHGMPTRLKVETSAQDLARAGMFQELLVRGAATRKPVVVVAGRGAKMRRRIGQWLIAAVVLLAMSIPAWLDLNKTLELQLLPHLDKLPTTVAMRSAFKTIDQLPDGSTALVIFDYDPAQAGEMNPIADVLLRHLIARGVNITAASLNPLGSSIAQAQWLKASRQLSDTVPFENLGFVAGQSIGVQQLLARDPSIGLVVDLAGAPDNLRWWVEQIAASNSNVPLIAGLSAGAEPLALLYIRSGQVQGAVVGMVGAFVYGQYSGLSPLMTDVKSTELQIRLESQTLAHWIMIAIILIGMLSALFSRDGRRSAA